MHVFFRDNEISGEKCEKLNKQHPGPCKDSKDSEESDENNETDDEEESGENNATGKSISVYIMFALSWLVIYNI